MARFPFIKPLVAIALLGALFANTVLAKNVEEFAVKRPYGDLIVAVHSPAEEKLAEDPLLLINLSSDRNAALPGGNFGAITPPFLQQGHRIASFDLPAHGDRVEKKYGSGIAGMAASVDAGHDVFSLLVEDGKAVIDELIKRGLAKPGRIVVCGVSRGGYCALRLAAADDRISAVAALAPVTDWRDLREFAKIKSKPAIAQLALTHYAAELAGKRIYVAIGNADSRVGTDACTRFVLAVNEAERAKELKQSAVRYLMVDDSLGHSLNTRWRREGIQFLLSEPASAKVQQALP